MSTYSKTKNKIKALESGLVQGQVPLTYLELGLLYQTVKEYDKAEKAFIKAANNLSNNTYPRFLLTKLYEIKGDRDKVNRLATELIQLEGQKMSGALKLELQKLLLWSSDTSSATVAPKSRKNGKVRKTKRAYSIDSGITKVS